MKRHRFGLLLLVSCIPALGAALTQDVDVRLRPDSSAPTIGSFRSGFEPSPVPSALATTPAGWMAVEVPGPFDAFVANGDITKTLTIREGAPLLLEPRAGAPVLATMLAGDTAEITALRGRWTEVRIQRSVVGYIPLSQPPVAVAAAAPPSPPMIAAPQVPILATPAPMPSVASTIGSPVQAVPAAGMPGDPLPRIFQGRFASSQRPFAPRRPYDYQINDNAGVRIAYVDLSGLMLTEQPENYLGRIVVVSGTAENSDDARAVVIRAETLVLR